MNGNVTYQWQYHHVKSHDCLDNVIYPLFYFGWGIFISDSNQLILWRMWDYFHKKVGCLSVMAKIGGGGGRVWTEMWGLVSMPHNRIWSFCAQKWLTAVHNWTWLSLGWRVTYIHFQWILGVFFFKWLTITLQKAKYMLMVSHLTEMFCCGFILHRKRSLESAQSPYYHLTPPISISVDLKVLVIFCW